MTKTTDTGSWIAKKDLELRQNGADRAGLPSLRGTTGLQGQKQPKQKSHTDNEVHLLHSLSNEP